MLIGLLAWSAGIAPAVSAADKKEARIQKLLEEARAFEGQGSLASPPGHNALVRYWEVLGLDQKNSEASQGIQRIQQYFIDQGESALAQGELHKARTQFERARRILDSEAVASWLAKLEKQEDEAAFAHARAKDTRLAWESYLALPGPRSHEEEARRMLAALPELTPGEAEAELASGECPPGMVLVDPGMFLMGSREIKGPPHERPAHRVYLDAFCIDIHEVTNKQFETFDPDHKSKRNEISECDDCPVIFVSWEQASNYCADQGKRLPTEAEWEKACRARMTGNRWPWGSVWDKTKVNSFESGNSKTVAVGSYPANAYGTHDMAGNVFEWVADWYEKEYYGHSPRENPTGPALAKSRVIRGGAWLSGSSDTRCGHRFWYDPAKATSNVIGFRCVAGPR